MAAASGLNDWLGRLIEVFYVGNQSPFEGPVTGEKDDEESDGNMHPTGLFECREKARSKPIVKEIEDQVVDP